MGVFLAAAIIFAVAFLGMGISVIRGKHCLGCSCKAARRIMNGTAQTEDGHCGERLHQLSDGNHQ